MSTDTTATEKRRLLSLDFFRGVTVIAMILVNNPGNGDYVYPLLEHSLWNGCTPADLIFPFFLFIMGVSVPYALDTKKQTFGKGALLRKAVKRSAILFGLGLFLSLFPDFDFSSVRIVGILPRIAVVYFLCVCLYLNSTTGWQVLILNCLLLAYYFFMVLVPVPGVGYPNTDPGINLATWADRLLITDAHLYKPYSPYNPAELLPTLTAMATGMTGVLTGSWLKRKEGSESRKWGYLLISGLFCMLTGLLWGNVFPLNKPLWTSSFVLYSSGWAMIGLSVSYWIIDVKGFKKWTRPFVVYGVNAITVFFLSVLLKRIARLIQVPVNGESGNGWGYLYRKFFEPFFTPYHASFAFALAFVGGWMLVLWWMYNRKIIVRI